MNRIPIAGAMLAILLGSAGPAQAQTVVYWPAPLASAQTAGMSYFPMGTPLTLLTRTQVSTKDNKPGDRLYLEVADALSYRGQSVVPAGSVAVAEVAALQRNGHFGRKGKLGIRLLSIETPSGPVRLRGQANDEGTSGTIPAAATMLFVSPLGFLIHGTSAQLTPGTMVQAYLAEDLRFAVQPPSRVTMTEARPDAGAAALAGEAQALPARFEAGAFGKRGLQSAQR